MNDVFDTDILKLLGTLYENDIFIWQEQGKLKYKSKEGKISKDILMQLKDMKLAIISFLQDCENNKFPMSPLQSAYLVGEANNCELGNTNAHYYIEYEISDIDVEKMQTVINELIFKHDVLRMIVLKEGENYILNNLPLYTLSTYQYIDCTEIKYQYIDLNKQVGIENFVKKCKIIINCSGLSCNMTRVLILKIKEHGCSYIEPQFNRLLKDIIPDRNIAFIQGVGSMPGLSGALPIYLSERFEEVNKIKIYYVGQGKFTHRAAEDYLNGIEDSNNYSMVCYENGELIPNIDKTCEFLPIFYKTYMLLPYYDQEAKEICIFLKPKRAEFYTAMEDNLTYRLLKNAREKYRNNSIQIIEDLCNASVIDSEKKSFCGFAICVDGKRDGKREWRTLILKADTAAILTGTTIAVMADLLIKRKVTFSHNVLSMWECQIQNRNLVEAIINNSRISANIYDCSLEDLHLGLPIIRNICKLTQRIFCLL